MVVTIGGSTPANVYANVPNYSGRSGGNNSTSGTFAGAGATTQPLGGQPPFDSPTTAGAVTKHSRSIASAGGRGPTIHVTDSSQLGSLLNNATLGPDGKVRVLPHERTRNPSVRGSTRTIAAELCGCKSKIGRAGVSLPVEQRYSTPNWTGFGRNGSRTGTLVGTGATNPQPLSQGTANRPATR